MRSAVKRIGKIGLLVLTSAAVALVGPAASLAQVAQTSDPAGAAQLTRHFQHEDALYAKLDAALGISPAYDEAIGGASQVNTALGISSTPAHDEGVGGASQLDTALGISSTPVHDEGMGGASRVDTALGISSSPVHDEAVGGASQVDNALGISGTRETVSNTRVVVQSGGFDWGDAGIGAGGGIGLVLLLWAAGSVVFRQKHRLSNA